MTALSLRGVSKRFGSAIAVESVTLDVAPGEMVVLLGPSGCGKTTTLRMIAGFVDVSGGDLLLDGVSIRGLPAHRRGIGIVFQSYALFPHLTVARNVAFGLEMHGVARAEREARVMEMLRLVKLEALAGRLPRQLSGGQQQRVAVARALAIRPRLLLLDEPLSNLDAALRQEVGRDLRILQRENGLTTIMVTHDQREAMAMADRLVVMREGRVEQIGTQEDLYERPTTPFVASFIGRSNIFPGTLSGGEVLDVPGSRIALACRYRLSGGAILAVRPEQITIAPPGTRADERAVGHVELSTYLGAELEHVVHLGSDLRVVISNSCFGPAGVRRFEPGESVALCWSAASERLFDDADRAIPPVGSDMANRTAFPRVASDA
ncbi:ABC transporter ATP-binding protein [Chelatococcus sp. GCM10030263]|uniref:ABC transporter ATP-binding protein n=1 Tax=Chelatococcus sp. GCM10030263 TaxID=3273387 RepID=UPI0036186ABD